jgi:multiple sugar transport system permease protein
MSKQSGSWPDVPSMPRGVAGAGTLSRRQATFDSLRKTLSHAAIYAILAVWTVVSLLPVLWMFTESSKPSNEVLSIPITFIPSRFELFRNIVQVFQVVPFARFFANSLLLVIVLGTTDILVSSMGGYALSKFRFPGRDVFFYFILGTMMISFVVILVPLYILVKQLGWLDTYLGLMAPGFVSAFGVFFMRQYISGIPSEYMDAARIDGASEIRLYWSVILPMIRPAIVTLAIFRFLWEWDSLLWPLIVVTKSELRTLPLALTYLVEQLGWSPHFTMVHVLTASLLATIPVLLFFLLLQRHFINAMTMAGLKF